ncbi:MAG: cupin domain-containing protein, partial [Anaerolineales bacterium]
RDDVSVIQERVPSNCAEVMHYHQVSHQFFFILEGEGVVVFEDHEVKLQKGNGLEIPSGVHHQFCNKSPSEVHFLVISFPTTRGDRINL